MPKCNIAQFDASCAELSEKFTVYYGFFHCPPWSTKKKIKREHTLTFFTVSDGKL